jgi:hypothetical protein
MLLLSIRQRYTQLLRDIKSDKYNHKKILPPFFLLIVLPFVFIFSPVVFFLFWLVFAFPLLFFLLSILCLLLSGIAMCIGCLYQKKRLRFWKMSLWFVVTFGIFWLAAFMSGPISGFAAHFGLRMVSSEIRFPMGNITAIDIDSKGRIYCADRSRCRLQIFSNDGEFLKGWFVPIANGGIYVSVGKYDSIRIDNISFKKSHIYDFNGRLLRVERNRLNTNRQPANSLRVSDDCGNIYRVDKTHFHWNISRISGREESILISDPPILSLFAMPFPAWALALFSLFPIGLSHSLVKKAERPNPSYMRKHSRISEPEKEKFQVEETERVNCLCEKIDILDGIAAHNYAKGHLKAINVMDMGRQIEYFCPFTGKLWLMDFTQEAKANQEYYSRLRPIPATDE